MRILNRHRLTKPWSAETVYVGRGHPLGNPYRIGQDGTREEVIEQYRTWLEDALRRENPHVLAALRTLRENSDLVCSCAPAPCHGDVIAEIWARERERLEARPAVFVFGSNLAGRHGAGAARYAAAVFGAAAGVGSGPTGQSYAIPTKDERLKTLPLERIAPEVRAFYRYAEGHPDADFLVTPIGCGLAGYRKEWIAPLFATPPRNVWFTDAGFDALVSRPVVVRRVIVAGSRSVADRRLVFDALDRLAAKWGGERFEVVCGEARGADALGREWARERGYPVVAMPARWNATDAPCAIVHEKTGRRYNARAGMDRNAWMAAYGTHLAAFWDGESSGTRHMIKTAEACGVHTWVKIISAPSDSRANQ
ncbi:MAG: hypothetical protein B7Z66_14450 [Chromatiales bacterium 21-64-14]|nr:MAG: hypothetical protein B7Z66_14450 [Chromatiales bacterium 21-64-14]